MRYMVSLLSILSIFLVSNAWYNARQTNKALDVDVTSNPNVSITGGPSYDAGTVADQQPVTHVFNIVNPHSFAVSLSAPVVGCSCTTAIASASVIPAHGSATVTLHVIPEDSILAGSVIVRTAYRNKKSEIWLLVNGKVANAKHS